MEWIEISTGVYESRAGAITMRVTRYAKWYVSLSYGKLSASIHADYNSLSSAKRAALRWAKRLQEGLR